jgi:hypothetical protein
MVLPGRALMTVYDPKALRVTVSAPQALLAELHDAAPKLRYELAGQGVKDAQGVQVLPTIDPGTFTAQLRFSLPNDAPRGAQPEPGQFVRVWLAVEGRGDARIFVPARAVVRRGELAGVYVLGADGQPRLRQVRTGPVQGDSVEILSGVADGDQVVSDAQQAARLMTREK